MNQFVRLAGTIMPALSTDQTASSVNHFITQRPTLTSRPETNEQPSPVGPLLALRKNRLSPRDTHSSTPHLLYETTTFVTSTLVT